MWATGPSTARRTRAGLPAAAGSSICSIIHSPGVARDASRAELAALAAEKEEAMKAARDSGLSARAFAVAWVLRDDAAVKAAGIDVMTLAKDVEELLVRFPNALVNADEQRRLRASLYKPLLALPQDERARVVDLVVRLLLAEASE